MILFVINVLRLMLMLMLYNKIAFKKYVIPEKGVLCSDSRHFSDELKPFFLIEICKRCYILLLTTPIKKSNH